MGESLNIKNRKVILVIILLTIASSIIWVPAIVLAASGNTDKFQYYLKALEYGLKGLSKYFEFIIDLFKAAVS